MNYDEAMNIEKVTFGDMPPQPFYLDYLAHLITDIRLRPMHISRKLPGNSFLP